ncbi:SpoIVB peptidase S55 domain-containing protein [Veillonella montpellierensis]|uniref:SpoIVB peptidase S55 domain-containing protein n=1 Tax=Veillonella montpellierensis TaxID=187328 RepID=UPI0023F7D22E|nr:SpoIVB peptidase S55 domain-containing protein [Veillonella montpellierensis]
MKLPHSLRRYGKGVLALFFCWSVAAQAQAVDFMPVADVKTGMEGIAKTVLVGDTISTFNVKVLGIMKDKGPSGDLILAKFSGPVMDKTGGIAHGMSGSPVYINGKLVGAVAYGWGFADGTIGMITPIADMVKLWNIPYEKEMAHQWQDGQLIPMGTPLMAYGFDRDALDYMAKKLPQYHYDMYDTAAANGDDVVKPLVPGGSVAALLVDGDLKLGAIGTVTYVDDDKVVAFGHPFLKHGSTNYFMHNSSIFTVVKSVESAFKLGSMGAEVGSVVEDRGSGIAGTVGRIHAGIPVRMVIRDLDTGKERTAYVKVIESSDMTPSLASTSLYTFLNKTLDRSGAGTATISYTITPRNTGIVPFTRKNMFYSADSISIKSVDEFYNVIDVLMNNRFINYDISDITIHVDVMEDKKTAKIVDATASPVIVSPGDTISVNVKLYPFRGTPFTKEVLYTVPKDQPLGDAVLEVRGGGVVPLPYVFEKQKYNLTDEIIRRLKTYKDFNEFYKELLTTDSNQQIVVEILDSGVSMVDSEGTSSKKTAKIDGVESNKLPGTITKKGNKDNLHKETKEERTYVNTDYIIQGDGQFNIQVMTPDKRDKMLAKKKKEAIQLAKMKLET